MKSLRDYIILEKLHIGKNMTTKKIEIEFPKVNSEDMIVFDDTWKTLDIPRTHYVIFNDYYRGKRMHFAETMDMLFGIAWGQEDFEDFDPNKDILYASNDFNDIFEWYCQELNIDIDKYKKMSIDEILDVIEEESDCDDTCDDPDFFAYIIKGQFSKEKDFDNYNPPDENFVKTLKHLFSLN